MKLLDMTCPKCGAQLTIDDKITKGFCEHCGNVVLIDDEAQHVRYDNAEEAGYNFEKGRQRAQEESRQGQNRSYTDKSISANNTQPQKKRKTWLWVLGWIFIFPVPLMVLMIRNKKMNPILKVAVIASGWALYILIGLLGQKYDKPSDDSINTSYTSSLYTNLSPQQENTTTEHETTTNIKKPLDDFFVAYIDHGRVDTIFDLAEEFGLFMDSKNPGTGRYYYKVALTKEDAKMVSLSDITKGDYCIVIDDGGESLTYYDNINFVEIAYSDKSGYSILDKCRLTPFFEDSLRLKVDTAEDALAYKANVETDISPLERFYAEAEIGMSKNEVYELIDKYGLTYDYRRSNSKDGVIACSKEIENTDDGTLIYFVIYDTLTDLDFYDYYVGKKYGLHVEYVKDTEASPRSGRYSEPGYYLVGDDFEEHYDSAEEAITALHSYRYK